MFHHRPKAVVAISEPVQPLVWMAIPQPDRSIFRGFALYMDARSMQGSLDYGGVIIGNIAQHSEWLPSVASRDSGEAPGLPTEIVVKTQI